MARRPRLRVTATSVTVSDSGFGISSLKARGWHRAAGRLHWVGGHQRHQRHLGARHQPVPRRKSAGPRWFHPSVIENGPVTRVTRQRARWQDSEIVLDIAQFAGLDFVELRFVIDWHEHEQMLKLEIPTALPQPQDLSRRFRARCSNATPTAKKSLIRIGQPCKARSASADYTVALLNNSTYSYDCLNGLFRTVLIRSAPFARHNPDQVPHNDNNAWQDQGRQERRFWLLGGRGGYADLALDRRAEELQTPAEYVMDSAHHGTEPWEQSFLEVMPAQRMGAGDQAAPSSRRSKQFSAFRSGREARPRRRSKAPPSGSMTPSN